MPLNSLLRSFPRSCVRSLSSCATLGAIAVAALPFAAIRAQRAPDTSTVGAEPLTGVRLGSNRPAVVAYLETHGWRVVADTSVSDGRRIGLKGKLDGRDAELYAAFGDERNGGRLVNFLVNLPAATPQALHATYAWAYRQMFANRCEPGLATEYRAQIDSVLAGRLIFVRGVERISSTTRQPMATTMAVSNIDWPEPIWLAREGTFGTALYAIANASGSVSPFQVTIWSSTLFALSDNATMCADTKKELERRYAERPLRKAAPGENIIIDTLYVAVTTGVRGTVDAVRVEGATEDEQVRLHAIPRPRGSRLAYRFTADSGDNTPNNLTPIGKGSATGEIVLQGNQELAIVADPILHLTPENRKLYDLYRAQLTSADPVGIFIDIECETERMMDAYPDRADRLIEAAHGLAVDEARDRKALTRIDDALDGYTFQGCAADRAHRPIRK